MIARPEDTASGRPFNNLLRRLNEADFALIEPHLISADGSPNDLLTVPATTSRPCTFPAVPASCPTW
jgi:hypothetical protein